MRMYELKDISREEAKNSTLLKTLYANRPARYADETLDKFVERMDKQSVGNNGYKLDSEFTCTGKVFVNIPQEGDNFTAYVAIETDEGANLSLKSLMGVSTLNGYHTESDAVILNEFDTDAGKATHEVSPYVSEHLDIAKLWNPKVRNFAQVVTQAEKVFTKGTKITYRGVAVRQLTASKDGEGINNETYRKGYKRAMSVRLWEVVQA